MDRTKVLRSFRDNWPSLLLVLVLLSAFTVLRTRPTDLADVAQFEALLTDGEPTVVEFYSNY